MISRNPRAVRPFRAKCRAQKRAELLYASDRGDVPGWVLVTIMTAGLVIVIWAIAAPALTAVFEQAIARVTGF